MIAVFRYVLVIISIGVSLAIDVKELGIIISKVGINKGSDWCGLGDLNAKAVGAKITKEYCAKYDYFPLCTGLDRLTALNPTQCDGWLGKEWNAGTSDRIVDESLIPVFGTKEEINCLCDTTDISNGGCSSKKYIRLGPDAWTECKNLHFVVCAAHGKILESKKMYWALDISGVAIERTATKNEVCYLAERCQTDIFGHKKGLYDCNPKPPQNFINIWSPFNDKLKDFIHNKLVDEDFLNENIKKIRKLFNIETSGFTSEGEGPEKIPPKLCGFIKVPSTLDLYNGNARENMNKSCNGGTFDHLCAKVPYSVGRQKLGHGCYLSTIKSLSQAYALPHLSWSKEPTVLSVKLKKTTICPIISFNKNYYNNQIAEYVKDLGFNCIADEFTNEHDEDGFRAWQLVTGFSSKYVFNKWPVTHYTLNKCSEYDSKVSNIITVAEHDSMEIIMFKQNDISIEKVEVIDINEFKYATEDQGYEHLQ